MSFLRFSFLVYVFFFLSPPFLCSLVYNSKSTIVSIRHMVQLLNMLKFGSSFMYMLWGKLIKLNVNEITIYLPIKYHLYQFSFPLFKSQFCPPSRRPSSPNLFFYSFGDTNSGNRVKTSNRPIHSFSIHKQSKIHFTNWMTQSCPPDPKINLQFVSFTIAIFKKCNYRLLLTLE